MLFTLAAPTECPGMSWHTLKHRRFASADNWTMGDYFLLPPSGPLLPAARLQPLPFQGKNKLNWLLIPVSLLLHPSARPMMRQVASSEVLFPQQVDDSLVLGVAPLHTWLHSQTAGYKLFFLSNSSFFGHEQALQCYQ